jgi:hypothetical protein
LARPPTVSTISPFLLKSLRVAIRTLMPLHRDLISIVDRCGYRYFSDVLINGLLMKSFIAYHGPESLIVSCLKFSSECTTIPFQLLHDAFLHGSYVRYNILRAFGGWRGLRVIEISIALSNLGSELILEIATSSDPSSADILRRLSRAPRRTRSLSHSAVPRVSVAQDKPAN